jgi:hypothetical protein
MPATRTTSPLLIAALALAVVVGLGGAYLIAGRATSPPAIESPALPAPSAAAPRAPLPPAPVRPSVQRPRSPPVPKLAPPPPATGASGQVAAAPVRPGEEPLAQVESSARQKAAAQLGLTPAESARVEAIHRAGDVRRAQIEATIDPRPGSPVGPVTSKLRDNAKQELDELAAVLGPDRARQLRNAEAEAFRDSWRAIADSPTTTPALRAVARRRLVFMRSGRPRPDEASPPAPPP